jgi:neutral ceramidase
MQLKTLNRLLVCTLFSTSLSLLVRPAVADEKAAEKTAIAELQAGFAERDITPPKPFPMAGYFHERLSEGTADPLLARAAVFSDGRSQAAIVVCDLIGIWTDFSEVVRQRASRQTGIPTAAIVVSATHSHTAPDYAAVFAVAGCSES